IGNSVIKRGFDIVVSAFLILLTSPLMLLIAIGVRMSSPGPVIFSQERIGKDKKPFRMLKFRSMRVTGTESTGWTTDRDSRRTKFGSFIRKTSLDEIPQFFNVLIGQMSLVGPRPEIPYHVSHYKEEIPRYLIRQQVRPGITGWAQINGLRGDTSIKKRVEYDLWYIDNWSFSLDLHILIKTLFGGMVNSEQLL
ncbi:MAG: exopolysaccharide biosynthesis polyprenyl glycosylphosphotransferase, partial [Clostridia bacterium]|nr:exopolysaccharide biosynthesis polyprenyl glycosylphosphotransferase [Clostridia bacterium]